MSDILTLSTLNYQKLFRSTLFSLHIIRKKEKESYDNNSKAYVSTMVGIVVLSMWKKKIHCLLNGWHYDSKHGLYNVNVFVTDT